MTIIREGRSGEDVKRLSIMFGLTPRITCDKELVEDERGETYTDPKDLGEDELPEIIGNYLRICMRNREDVVIENVHLSDSLMKLSYSIDRYEKGKGKA